MIEFAADDFRPQEADGGRPPDGRLPVARDCWVFFVGLPLFFALWATAVGIGPARVLGFEAGLLYIATQMSAAWWGNGLACHGALRLLRRYRPPTWLVLLAGYGLGWLPLYIFYRYHFAFFSNLFPEIVAPAARPASGWNAAYLFHAARYSLPFIPIWFAAVYGYRLLTGVRFFCCPEPARPGSLPARPAVGTLPPEPAPMARRAAASAVAAPGRAQPAFLSASRLPPDAVILAIKAEEHYIRIWSKTGTDLVRYRFKDAVGEIPDDDGDQVHRSWWINWDAVAGWHTRGRSLELELDNGLRVPVSLAYKAETHRRLISLDRQAREQRKAG
jgi:hypothetical protein